MMSHERYRLGIVLFLLCVGGAFSLGVAASGREGAVAPARDPLYLAECGSCHFAYPPALLPARSWERTMNGLERHFGENAEVADATGTALRGYLAANAADRAGEGKARKFLASIATDEIPERITTTRYFVHKHREIPRSMWEKNPKLGSLSRCEGCHARADQGSFDEHEVRIPGVGRWED
ncbi:MAG: diheme cytochrome c [Magnetococcales bacterium]|nr:diheme cytochrome c [Magnetococcales bacterium]